MAATCCASTNSPSMLVTIRWLYSITDSTVFAGRTLSLQSGQVRPHHLGHVLGPVGRHEQGLGPQIERR